MNNITALIMAAGTDDKMKSKKSKLAQTIYGKEVIKRVVNSVKKAGIEEVGVIVGENKEEIESILKDEVKYIYQEQCLGTGHAIMQAIPYLEEIRKFNLSFNVGFHKANWLVKFKSNLIPLGALFFVYRGAKTGQDDIFISQSPDVVDKEYVSLMLKNSKGCDTLIAKPDNYFITSDKTYKELESLGHTKTIQYFKQFENNLNQSVLQHGDIWYNLKEAKKKFLLITGLNPDKRLFFAKFTEPTCINQRLIGFIPKVENLDINLCHALLNSIVGMFYIEATGFGRGAGALEYRKSS